MAAVCSTSVVQLSELVVGHGLGRPPLRLLQLVEQAEDRGRPDRGARPASRSRSSGSRSGARRGTASRHDVMQGVMSRQGGGNGPLREVTSPRRVRNWSLTRAAKVFTLPRDPPNRVLPLFWRHFPRDFRGLLHTMRRSRLRALSNRAGRTHFEVAAVISVLGLVVMGRPLLAGGLVADGPLTVPATARSRLRPPWSPRPRRRRPDRRRPRRRTTRRGHHLVGRRPLGLVRPRRPQPGHREPGPALAAIALAGNPPLYVSDGWGRTWGASDLRPLRRPHRLLGRRPGRPGHPAAHAPDRGGGPAGGGRSRASGLDAAETSRSSSAATASRSCGRWRATSTTSTSACARSSPRHRHRRRPGRHRWVPRWAA